MLGEHQKAIVCLDEAIGLKPTIPLRVRPRGMSLQALGRHQEAIACLDEPIRLDRTPLRIDARGCRCKSSEDTDGVP